MDENAKTTLRNDLIFAILKNDSIGMHLSASSIISLASKLEDYIINKHQGTPLEFRVLTYDKLLKEAETEKEHIEARIRELKLKQRI